MRVFVLGATGWIGGAIVDKLLLAHHQVIGLARSESAKKTLETKGVTSLQGEMSDYELLRPLAEQADGVIIASSASLDITIETVKMLITTLQGTHKPLIYVSGSSLYGEIGSQKNVGEQMFLHRLNSLAMQQSPEKLVYGALEQEVHGMIVVGAGILYGRGGGTTPTFWLNDARQRRVAWFINSGTQRWSAVHVEDMAQLIVQTLEQKPAQRVFNAVAESLSLHGAAETIAQVAGADVGARNISVETAKREWGSFWATVLSENLWLSATQAEQVLGWKPSSMSFKDDLLRGSY